GCGELTHLQIKSCAFHASKLSAYRCLSELCLKPKRDVKSHLRFVERGVCIVVGEVLYLALCLGVYKVAAN
ncbi:hypothetical protein, partial [Pseudoalteromonas sp. BSi20495]|uniref:hypothetical protein n=1 Tax=Pseudoalteromonas sp. BSi20495 TaxID=386429 RepID=UPI0006ACDE11